MTTSQLDSVRKLDRKDSAIALAVTVIRERMARISDEDRELVWLCFRSLMDASTHEEYVAAHEAMLEVLDQQDISVSAIDVDENTDIEIDKASKIKFETWKQYIANTVKKFRDEAGVTQQELSAQTGLPQSHISRIECAKLSPSDTTLQKIADALKIPVGKLDPCPD